LFGITNVPFGLWVDETGTIVRPPEVAFAPQDERSDGEAQRAALAQMIEQLPPDRRAVVEAMTRNTAVTDRDKYAVAVRDWVANGANSTFVLSSEQVRDRSRALPWAAALAAAEFELAAQLHIAGHKLDAVPHFQEAHRLDPDNWSYAREAFSLVDESMGDPYGTDLLAEVARVGTDTFYPSLDM
jgi:hypothetical protein